MGIALFERLLGINTLCSVAGRLGGREAGRQGDGIIRTPPSCHLAGLPLHRMHLGHAVGRLHVQLVESGKQLLLTQGGLLLLLLLWLLGLIFAVVDGHDSRVHLGPVGVRGRGAVKEPWKGKTWVSFTWSTGTNYNNKIFFLAKLIISLLTFFVS